LIKVNQNLFTEIGYLYMEKYITGKLDSKLPIKTPSLKRHFKYSNQSIIISQEVGVFHLENRVFEPKTVHTFTDNTFIKIYGESAGVYKLSVHDYSDVRF